MSKNMLVVRFLLWPGGDATKERELATIAMENVGGDKVEGDYRFAVSHQHGTPWWKDGATPFDLLEGKNAWKRGQVFRFPRKLGVVILLQRAFQSLSQARRPSR